MKNLTQKQGKEMAGDGGKNKAKLNITHSHPSWIVNFDDFVFDCVVLVCLHCNIYEISCNLLVMFLTGVSCVDFDDVVCDDWVRV